MNPIVTLHVVPGLDDSVRGEMFAMMCRHYEAIDEANFQQDLSEKDFVLLLTEEDRLLGFTTGFCRKAEVAGREIRYIYSGDTVVEPEYWGPGYLIHAFFRAAGNFKAAAPDVPLYWLLLVKSHRTYRILSSFFRQFVPRIGRPNDPDLLTIRDDLAARKFGECFDPATGLIDFGVSRGHLAPALQNEETRASGNAIVREFIALNAHSGRGVELTCLAEFSLDNLRSYAISEFERGFGEGAADQEASTAVRLAS
jgi:hypothetical protein